MTTTEIKRIIKDYQKDIAFVIGNGINRYPDRDNEQSWDKILIKLWNKAFPSHPFTEKPNGISLTEFYDIIDIQNNKEDKEYVKLKKTLSDPMNRWEPFKHHKVITEQIQQINAPILTTNFDETLKKASNSKLFRTEKEKFTDFYPWTTYHGNEQLSLPTDGFGIWYINGMIKYPRSIKLGLSHYMGNVERARTLLQKKIKEKSLFYGNSANDWQGNKTWLHIFFNKSLFIFGLRLEENETFLRWLLIQRQKYFKKFPDRKGHDGWYLDTHSNIKEMSYGKKLFLKSVGVQVIEVADYADIYENIW